MAIHRAPARRDPARRDPARRDPARRIQAPLDSAGRIQAGPARTRRTRRTPHRSMQGRVLVRTGFSLVELVMVLAITAIFAAIAVPRFADAAARARVVTAAERLGAELVITRDRARAASEPRSLRVTRNSGVVEVLDADQSVLAAIDFENEPYRARVVRTSLAGGEIAFTAYALPVQPGRIMLRSAGYLAIVSVASDGTVSVSSATPAQTPDPLLADVVTQLGDNLTARDIIATPGNGLRGATEDDK